MKKFKMIAAGLLLLIMTMPAMGATYTIDQSHSSVDFKIRHLVVSKIRGAFDVVSGEFDYEEGDSAAWRVKASIDASSISTGNQKRDDHLRGEDFLNTARFPTMEFEASHVSKGRDGAYLLHGNLTLHGVTKHVELAVEFNGSIKDPWGGTRVGFSASGELNRTDFGLTWNKALEAGGLMVGETVEIFIEIEGIRNS